MKAMILPFTPPTLPWLPAYFLGEEYSCILIDGQRWMKNRLTGFEFQVTRSQAVAYFNSLFSQEPIP